MSADLDFALALANEADALSLPRFRAVDLRVETKPDLTPVTDADRTVERALRERLGDARVLGEEEGGARAAEGDVWILDPIDGTKNFSRGIPVWATLIALERDGELVLGVVSAPALGHRWWAARGEGAYRDGERLDVSRIARLEEATVSFSRSGLDAAPAHVLELVRRSWHAQPFSDFWAHLLVAEGAVEVAVEHEMNVWDNAALQVKLDELIRVSQVKNMFVGIEKLSDAELEEIRKMCEARVTISLPLGSV